MMCAAFFSSHEKSTPATAECRSLACRLGVRSGTHLFRGATPAVCALPGGRDRTRLDEHHPDFIAHSLGRRTAVAISLVESLQKIDVMLAAKIEIRLAAAV